MKHSDACEPTQVVFMDNDTYEETRLRREESWAKWLKEGDTVPLISWNGLVITVDVPKSVTLAITETEPGIQGNRSSSGTKSATLETGAKVQVISKSAGSNFWSEATTGCHLLRCGGCWISGSRSGMLSLS